MTNQELAAKIAEMAAYYEMRIGPATKASDPIRFKPRAYERAAEAIEIFPEPIEEMFRHGGEKQVREEVRGVGPGIAAHIASLIKTGTFPELEAERKKAPVKIAELMQVDGVGPKAIKTLWTELGVKDLKTLEEACERHEIRNVPRFGEKSEQKIFKSVQFLKSAGGRHLLGEALPISRRLEERLKEIPGVKQAITAGSIRRRQETIGDIDILITASDPQRVQEAFLKMPEVRQTVRRGEGEGIASVILAGGIHADIRVLKSDEYGAGLQYFTGDKNHNVKLRTLAIKKGLKLSEYGLFKGKKKIAGATEKEIYEALGLAEIPPELRTDSGEIEAALEGKLPELIGYGSLRGDLQVQTDWTDGEETIEEMAQKAKRAGLEYIAITDHAKSLAMTGGLDEKKLAKQSAEIAKLNSKLRGFRILSGSEVNIGRDGSLDIEDEALSRLDFVGASVHSYFSLPRAEQTKRIIRAMENPNVDIIFHPTGRIIGKRPPLELDMAALIAAAKRTGTALEINASPDRLDIRDEFVRLAVKAGVKLAINSDAHSSTQYRFLEYGIAQARRGWATKTDVINARSAEDFLAWCRKPKEKR